MRDDVLVEAEALAGMLRSERPPVVLDVRWSLGGGDGRELHASGHVPGAVYVDMDTELAGPASAGGGRHPLPSIEQLESAARRWGIRGDSVVVAYDDVGNTSAARAWWLLRWGGLERVSLLDGGLRAWWDAGFELEAGSVEPSPGDVVLTPGHMPTLDADAAARLAREGVLLDARAAERYRGEREPIDPVAGHIPGALSAPVDANLAPDGRFAGDGALRRRYRSLGVDGAITVGVYCGSGVAAAHHVAALAVAGFEAALYPGSWSQWCGDPSRPIALGREPG